MGIHLLLGKALSKKNSDQPIPPARQHPAGTPMECFAIAAALPCTDKPVLVYCAAIELPLNCC